MGLISGLQRTSDLNLVKEINAVFCIKHPISREFPSCGGENRSLMSPYSTEPLRSYGGGRRTSGMFDLTVTGSRGEKGG